VTLSNSTTARIAADMLDSLNIVGGAVVGTTVGRLVHARTTDRYGSVSRLVAGVTAGVATAALTDSLLGSATTSWRRTLRDTEPTSTPAASPGQARPRVAAQAATDAERKAMAHWYWSDPRHRVGSDDLWQGYEDGTATYYLAPGLYLRYQPDHDDLGTKHSVDWTAQYTLESGEGTTLLSGPAHLLELLDSPGMPATGRGREA
jgi:hypothetical protein